jgi:hypothetical protein
VILNTHASCPLINAFLHLKANRPSAVTSKLHVHVTHIQYGDANRIYAFETCGETTSRTVDVSLHMYDVDSPLPVLV